mgnify:CR=1 FL=1
MPEYLKDNNTDVIDFMIDELATAHGISKRIIEMGYTKYDYEVYKIRLMLSNAREKDYLDRKQNK